MFAGIWWCYLLAKNHNLALLLRFGCRRLLLARVSGRINSFCVQVSVKFFIHHEFAVLPEEEEWQPGTRIKRQILRALLLLHRILETLANR
jgi:hypothetical protein